MDDALENRVWLTFGAMPHNLGLHLFIAGFLQQPPGSWESIVKQFMEKKGVWDDIKCFLDVQAGYV